MLLGVENYLNHSFALEKVYQSSAVILMMCLKPRKVDTCLFLTTSPQCKLPKAVDLPSDSSSVFGYLQVSLLEVAEASLTADTLGNVKTTWWIGLLGKIVWVGICGLLELGGHCCRLFWLLKSIDIVTGFPL